MAGYGCDGKARGSGGVVVDAERTELEQRLLVFGGIGRSSLDEKPRGFLGNVR
jgi:hypothetical protein